MRRALALAAAAAWLFSSPAVAQTPPAGGFRLPVDCRVNEDCWIANYFDVETGPEARDFRCSSRTYDGHDGIDIAVRDRKAMASGVAVLAGAPAVVAFVRDGEPDGAFVRDGPAATHGRDCGNAVVLDYGNSWNAQFCHLREGSLRVRVGERVEATAVLGLVGMSGKAAFPHLHWILRQGRTNLDPFTGRPASAACTADASAQPLWHSELGLKYEPFSLYAAGFDSRQRGPDDVIADAEGKADLPRDAVALGLWAAIYGVRPGDRIVMRVTGPTGTAFVDGNHVVERAQALHVPFLGRRRGDAPWPAGRYQGTVTIERTADGRTLRQTREASVEIR